MRFSLLRRRRGLLLVLLLVGERPMAQGSGHHNRDGSGHRNREYADTWLHMAKGAGGQDGAKERGEAMGG